MSHATHAANGNGTEYSLRDDVRAALAELLEGSPADDSEMPILTEPESVLMNSSEQIDDMENGSYVLTVPNDGRPIFHESRSFVVVRGLSIEAAYRVACDLNRPWVACFRKNHYWHAVCKMGKAFGVLRVKIIVPGSIEARYDMRHRSCDEWPPGVEWMTGVQRGEFNRMARQALKDNPDAKTRQWCVRLWDCGRYA